MIHNSSDAVVALVVSKDVTSRWRQQSCSLDHGLSPAGAAPLCSAAWSLPLHVAGLVHGMNLFACFVMMYYDYAHRSLQVSMHICICMIMYAYFPRHRYACTFDNYVVSLYCNACECICATCFDFPSFFPELPQETMLD